MAKSLAEIGRLLEHTKFQKKLFGGVDELDVWTKIGRLQREYMEVIDCVKQEQSIRTAEWRGYACALENQVMALGGALNRPQNISDEIQKRKEADPDESASGQ